MAKISTIKEAVLICRDANITPFVWGHRGLGKSSLVKQIAEDNGWGFIDLRCSQLEASDIRGLPDRGEDNRTHYLPPADMPIADMSADQVFLKLAEVLGIDAKGTDGVDTAGKLAASIAKKLDGTNLDLLRRYENLRQALQPRFERGILFLDEVNRAQDDVLQAIFQLVLDRRVGQYVLPPGWCVVAAGNFTEGYRVGGFDDPAFLNRFCHLTLSGGETTLEEWVNYMASVHGGDATDVIEFASQNTKHLDGDIKGEMGFSVQPSRRGWEMVTRVMKVVKEGKYSESAKIEVYAGLLGRELAQSFSRYSCPVKPRELINNGVKAYESKLKKLDRNQLTGLMWGLVSFCKNQIEKDEIATVCLDFASFMVDHANDKDVVVAFCRALVTQGGAVNDHQEKARAAVISNPRLAKMISKFNKRSGSDKKSFVDRLTERPEFQSVLSKVSWGVVDDEA
jgi:MoxR-like ATPase